MWRQLIEAIHGALDVCPQLKPRSSTPHITERSEVHSHSGTANTNHGTHMRTCIQYGLSYICQYNEGINHMHLLRRPHTIYMTHTTHVDRCRTHLMGPSTHMAPRNAMCAVLPTTPDVLLLQMSHGNLSSPRVLLPYETMGVYCPLFWETTSICTVNTTTPLSILSTPWWAQPQRLTHRPATTTQQVKLVGQRLQHPRACGWELFNTPARNPC